jgi:hypothetical protein
MQSLKDHILSLRSTTLHIDTLPKDCIVSNSLSRLVNELFEHVACFLILSGRLKPTLNALRGGPEQRITPSSRNISQVRPD